jgi:ABC-type polysaccharide/polyol phosphate export permease
MSRSFITRIYFPKIIILLSAIVVCLLISFLFFSLLSLCYFIFRFLSLSLEFFPAIWRIVNNTCCTRDGNNFSILNIFYKDIRELLPLITSFLFFNPVVILENGFKTI